MSDDKQPCLVVYARLAPCTHDHLRPNAGRVAHRNSQKRLRLPHRMCSPRAIWRLTYGLELATRAPCVSNAAAMRKSTVCGSGTDSVAIVAPIPAVWPKWARHVL